MTAHSGPQAPSRRFPAPRRSRSRAKRSADARAARKFVTSCPVPRCDERLGPAGLTCAHVDQHLRRDGAAVVAEALVKVHAHHVRLVRLEAASFESIRSCLSRDILEELARRGTLTLREVAEGVGERPSVCQRALARLVRRGVVHRERKGVYRLLVDGGQQ